MPTKADHSKKYYDKNRIKIIEHLKTKILCEVCNQLYPLYALSRHRKTLKHINNSKKA